MGVHWDPEVFKHPESNAIDISQVITIMDRQLLSANTIFVRLSSIKKDMEVMGTPTMT